METLLQDVRYGIRMLVKSPGFTVVAVLTLALGIGANTAIFSLINAVLLRMLPVKNPGELVVVGDPGRANDRSLGTPQVDIFSYALYKDLRDGNHVFSDLLASGNEHRLKVETDRSGEITTDATGALVSGNYFSVLGVNALAGRTLLPDDDRVIGGHPVAVVSYRFWQEKLSGDPGVVGQSVRLNGAPFTIVGVGPAGFIGDTVGDTQDFWIPMMMQGQIIHSREWLKTYNVSWLRLIGRLKPGENIARAKADLNVVFQQVLNGPAKSKIEADDMAELHKSQINVVEGGRGFSDLRPGFHEPLYLLMGMVVLVLLIACVNVSNLLLARASARRKEIAVRLSIGASRARLVRQLLTESLLLSFGGAAFGLLLASWGTHALLRLSLGRLGQDKLQASLDPRVLAFTAAVALLTGILFGLIPALRSFKFEVTPALKESSTATSSESKASGWNWGKALVVSQVALSVLVLFAAGLLVRSLSNLQNVDFGYNREHLLLIRTDPLSADYKPPKLSQFYDEVARRLANLPGVRGVSASMNGLFSGSESATTMKVEGYVPAHDEDRTIYLDAVGPDYFSTLGVSMILGRDIRPQDTATSPQVVVVNEAMARFYFKDSNPIGKKIWADDDEHRKLPPYEIVGVARNAQDHDLHQQVQRRFYVPIAQYPDALSNLNFEVRTVGDHQAVVEAARKEIAAFDSRVPVLRIRTLNELVNNSINNEIMIARLSSFFGVLALLLACVGLYGVMSYAVSGRTREIGVRMAVGASRQDVLLMVLRGAMTLIVVGVLIGIPAAFATSRLIQSMLFHLTAFDPLSMGAVILLLGAVATIAGLIPARRATKVNPMVALRYE